MDSLSAVQVSYGLLSSRLGFLATSPIAGSIRGLFYLSRRYVASRLRVGRSQQNFILYYSVVRLGQSPVSVLLLSCFCNSSGPVIISWQSATVGLHLHLRLCLRLHDFAIVSNSSLDPRGVLGLPLSSSVSAIVLFSQSSSFRHNLDLSQHHRLFLSQYLFLRFRYPVSLQPNLLLRSY